MVTRHMHKVIIHMDSKCRCGVPMVGFTTSIRAVNNRVCFGKSCCADIIALPHDYFYETGNVVCLRRHGKKVHAPHVHGRYSGQR